MAKSNSGRTIKTAVVLAAGAPPAALGSIFGRTSSAMVPVNGRPTIHWLLHYLHKLGVTRVVLGLRHTETRLPRFVQQAFGRIQEIICVPVKEGMSQAVEKGRILPRCAGRHAL
jgi:NDP-sugar pyrophosphorylase family protein